MPRIPSPRFAIAALFASLAMASPAAAQDAARESGKRKPPAKVTFHKAPSEESPQAREKRLKRECRGRPNAGMCAGYTR